MRVDALKVESLAGQRPPLSWGRRRALTLTVRSSLPRFWNREMIRDIDKGGEPLVAPATPTEELVP